MPFVLGAAFEATFSALFTNSSWRLWGLNANQTDGKFLQLVVCFGALVLLLLLLFMLFPEVVHLDRCFSGGDEEAAQEG